MPGGSGAERPRWREDFPVRWDADNYMTRRELAKFLTLGSGLLASVNVLIAFIGLRGALPTPPTRRIAGVDEVPPGGSLLFRYPTADDPCILVRDASGTFEAFSQVCTHLSCAVVHRPDEQALACPCHKGSFSSSDGRPLAGPPTRRLPRIVLEQHGADLVATGIKV
jgi:arsenite oxidase small subunit